MDPKACWERLCDLVNDGLHDEACWAIDDLCEWLGKGGFRPDGVPTTDVLRGLQRGLEAIMRTEDA